MRALPESVTWTRHVRPRLQRSSRGRRGPAAELVGQGLGLGGVTAYHLNFDVGRSRVSPQGSNLGVFVEGHHVDNVHTLAGKDDLHVNDCFSARHVQRH